MLSCFGMGGCVLFRLLRCWSILCRCVCWLVCVILVMCLICVVWCVNGCWILLFVSIYRCCFVFVLSCFGSLICCSGWMCSCWMVCVCLVLKMVCRVSCWLVGVWMCVILVV